MFYICTNRKKVLIFLGGVIAASILIIALAVGVKAGGKADEYKDRVAFLEGLGCVVDETAKEEQKSVLIPEEFSDVYINYNEVQKQCGYDLTAYKGFTLTQYTLKLSGYQGRDDVYAHLLVYNGRIVGGDIAATALDGFMKGLENAAG